MNNKEKIKKYWRLVAIFILATVFFIGTSSYNFITQKDAFIKWGSPDETANYIVSKLYAQSGEMIIYEKYNLLVDDIMRSRSFRSDHGNLKPVSFLGIIIIFGFLAKYSSYLIIPYLTPLFAAFGLVFYYLLIEKIFTKRIAFFSTFVLSVFPVYIYYTVRSMFHNVLFMVLLLAGFYFLVLMIEKKGQKGFLKMPKKENIFSWLWAALAGFFMGLAVISRTSEIIWLAPSLFIVWLFYIRRIGIIKLILFCSFVVLATLPMFYWNQILYGSMISGGYPAMNDSIYSITKSGSEMASSFFAGSFHLLKDLAEKIKAEIFYFGFKPKLSYLMFENYILKMFSWLVYLAVFGFLLFLFQIKQWKKKHLVYLMTWLFLSLILILYYGSWQFYDNPDKTRFTIGNSYTRYWLPIYLGLIPYAAFFVVKISRTIFGLKENISKQKKVINKENEKINLLANSINKEIEEFKKEAKNNNSSWLKKIFQKPNFNFLSAFIQIGVFSLIAFHSLTFVLYGSEEGLIYGVVKNASARQEYNEVMNLSESNSVIITYYHDKIFFPERKVIVGLFDDPNMNLRYSKLINYLPVYYYNFSLKSEDLIYLNERRFADLEMEISLVKKINHDFSLYQLSKNERVGEDEKEEKDEEELSDLN